MDMLDIITHKRDGITLTGDEIRYFISGYTAGDIPDYQAAALLMAIYFRGLDLNETYEFTASMKDSGDIIDLSEIKGVKVDKHSTGGVGDKITLIVAPVAAACGVPVAKLSGRGLGFTGGTADKLEAIPNFRTILSEDEFVNQVNDIGVSVMTQSIQVAVADKLLYALRDATATVANSSLIASSIMSKKLASGADAIALDVKCGSGAFMKDRESAVELAEMMMGIGRTAGKDMLAVVSDMDQPLGNAVGNSIEVIEAIDTLRGRGPSDVTELSIALTACMMMLGGKADNYEEGRERAHEAIMDGSALSKFTEMIGAQDGDTDVIENYDLFEIGTYRTDIRAESPGYVEAIDTEAIGMISQRAGAGRVTKDDAIDYGAGVLVNKKIGDKVAAGDILMTVIAEDEDKSKNALDMVPGVYTIGGSPVERPVLIKEILGI